MIIVIVIIFTFYFHCILYYLFTYVLVLTNHRGKRRYRSKQFKFGCNLDITEWHTIDKCDTVELSKDNVYSYYFHTHEMSSTLRTGKHPSYRYQVFFQTPNEQTIHPNLQIPFDLVTPPHLYPSSPTAH